MNPFSSSSLQAGDHSKPLDLNNSKHQSSGLLVQGTGAVIIYADGACRGNPGPGGWGVLLQHGEHERELFGGESLTTNNRMELRAVIEGLLALKRSCEVSVYTDSQYVQKGISEWIKGWKARGWLTADRKPVKNADLWGDLESAAQPHQVTWHWVKGHAGHPGNERADSLANRGIDESTSA